VASVPPAIAPWHLALDKLYPFESLRNIASAADRLASCLHVEGCILVVGDYDADGATGSALLARGLRTLGASRVSYLIPSRFTSGYGLGPAVVDAAAGLGADLIITVDNGISSLAGIRWAYELDIPVIITDHHLPGSELPNARGDRRSRSAGECVSRKIHRWCRGRFLSARRLAGPIANAGLVRSRSSRAQSGGISRPSRFGHGGGCGLLDCNNHILVEQNLRRIRAGRCCPGITALLEVAGRDPGMATARDLGFTVGPWLNAAPGA